MPTTGEKQNDTWDMRGLSYDDEKWDTLLDQLTVSDMDTMIALADIRHLHRKVLEKL